MRGDVTSVLFLDIDGVLESIDFKTRLRQKDPQSKLWNVLDPEAVTRLNRIVAATGCSVVVSSTWRKSSETNTPGKLRRMLAQFGYEHNIYDITPVDNGCKWHQGECSAGHRGGEIGEWLKENPEVTTYAIVDDGGDMGPYSDHLVQTDCCFGLEDRHIERLIVLLQ